MIRRSFLAGLAGALPVAVAAATEQSNRPRFKLRYGPHPGMFKNSAGEDIIDQIKFAADQGFTGWEDNGAISRPPELQFRIGSALQQLGMTMGVFVSLADFRTSDFITKTDRPYQDSLRDMAKRAVETAKRVGTKWTTVVPSTVNNS